MLRFSFTNLAETAGVTATEEDSVYVATNIREPWRPFKPWKSAGLGGATITVDLGGSTPVDVIALINATFTVATVNGSVVALKRTPNFRYHIVVPATALSTFDIVIPPQAPTDNDIVFRLGGIHVGTWTTPPRQFELGDTWKRIFPHQDNGPDGDAWEDRVVVGRPRMQVSAARRIPTGAVAGVDDVLSEWWELERQMYEAGVFLVQRHSGDPTQAYIMRLIEDLSWQQGTIGPDIADGGGFVLRECVGPNR